MKTSNNKFVESFYKTSASKLPQWLQNANKSMKTDSLKQHSKHSLTAMLKRRGIGK